MRVIATGFCAPGNPSREKTVFQGMGIGRLAIVALLVSALWAQPGPPQGGRPGMRGRQGGGIGQQSDLMQGTARVEGTVTHRRTGEPVSRALVYLMRSDGSQGVSLLAGADGKFVFENVVRGVYRVSAERRGFLRGDYGSRKFGQRGALITLTDGQEMKGADVKLDPQSVIAGQILDEHGEPMQGVNVMAMRRLANDRQGTAVQSGNTDDRGEFRIAGLAPGRYYVQANAMPRSRGRVVRRLDLEEEANYVATYFPGTADVNSAVPVELGVGQEFLGLSLQVQMARVYKVTGTVQGAESRSLRVVASQRGVRGAPFGGSTAGVNQNGHFELAGLTPGTYTIVAAQGGPGGGAMAKAVVEVSNADLEGVNLVFGTMFQVQGTIKVEGAGASSPGNLRLQLVAEDAGFFSPNGQSKADGTFTIDRVSPDRYRLAAAFLPNGQYVKSVRMSGQDLMGKVIDMTSGAPGRIDIVLGNKPATVSGTVTRADPESLPGTVIVVLDPMPDGPVLPGTRWEVSVDQNGAFTLGNVPPGTYRVYSFEEFDRTEGFEPEFLKKFESSSEQVKLGEGDTKTLSLKQIPGDAVGQ